MSETQTAFSQPEPPVFEGNSLQLPTLSLNDATVAFGKEIFAQMTNEKPSFFTKNYWSSQLMQWSFQRPSLKQNLFRLVDVLPALQSSAEIVEHVQIYLGEDVATLHPLAHWGVKAPPRSLRGKLLAASVRKGVKEMANQFIAGATPKDALKQLRRLRKSGFAYTVDLLGEYSLSEREAVNYLQRYIECVDLMTTQAARWSESKPLYDEHEGECTPSSVSVKLSALYSQVYPLNAKVAIAVLSERLAMIVRQARAIHCQIYCDAEDSDKWEIVNETYKNVFSSSEFKDYPLPGIVIQAYSKESIKITEEMIDFARARGSRIAIRLVKGAYWDYETALSLQHSWESPLFSLKRQTDANYEALSRLLLDNIDVVYPAFGSHNVRSLSYACCYALQREIPTTKFELQVLYGMADPIALAFKRKGYLVRHYVPVGDLIPGMGYFVRRLLENTSNESFLRHTYFDSKELNELLADPAAQPESPFYDHTSSETAAA
jgi:RHH-type transcriptional regulator, proline utilization regulon repressor / proline dehydrogenase / delta 1-pyrroline-5-carboxylate dehydrogenase